MKKFTLLYAEDEQETRKEHIRYLESRYALKVYEANDGEEALALYKQYKPDIVLTDITMPKMDGLKFIEEIRKESLRTKVIILTAHSDREKLLKALELQLISYIVKPLNRKKLQESMEIAMSMCQEQERDVDKVVYLNEEYRFDMESEQYYQGDTLILLTKAESSLLFLLCKNRSKKVSSLDIFLYVWDDFDKEYSANSVRTLVKNLRKKLPRGALQNVYGGYYSLV
jgi:DNA-binding response OmpR family regulator